MDVDPEGPCGQAETHDWVDVGGQLGMRLSWERREERLEASRQKLEEAYQRMQRQRSWGIAGCNVLAVMSCVFAGIDWATQGSSGVKDSLQTATIFVLVRLILRLQMRVFTLEHDGLQLSLGVRLSLQGEPDSSKPEPERKH